MSQKSFSNLTPQGKHSRISRAVQQELNNLIQSREEQANEIPPHNGNNRIDHIPPPVDANVNNNNHQVLEYENFPRDDGDGLDENLEQEAILEVDNLVREASDSDAEEIVDENDQVLVDSSSESDAEEIFEANELDDNEVDLKDFLIQWFYECNINKRALTKLLHGLRRFNHVPVDLPMDARTLLSTPRRGIVPERMGSGEFHYYGLRRALTNQMNFYDPRHIPQHLELDIFVDGLSLSKSSHSQLFPTLGKVVNAPIFTEMFIISIYHGVGKPDDPHEFMRSFSEEYVALRDEGFLFNNRVHYVRIRAIITDTVARVFLLCFPSHSSRCGKCIQNARRVLDTCVFLDSDAELRTLVTLRLDLPPAYQNIRSPLEYLVHPLNQVPLDPMHQVNLGVAKKHIALFLKALGNIGDGRVMDSLDNDFTSLQRWTPCEFNRKIRSIKHFCHLKATELRTILLYVGPVIFSKYMTSEAMTHFNALHLAVRILSDSDHCVRNNNFAKQLLRFYVEQMRRLYGDHMLVYNVHNLLHLSDEVLRFGTLDNFSAIGFESYLYIMKKMLKNGTNILSQIVNRVNEMSVNQIRLKTAPRLRLLQGRQFMMTKPKRVNNLPQGYFFAHDNIQFSNFTLSNKVPDNCCYMKDGTIVEILHICKNAERISVILGRKILNCQPLDDYMIDSRRFGICKSASLSEDLFVWPVSQVHKKAFRVCLDGMFYLFPMLHTHNF
ncbi:hypothetical protein QAD02_016485 [Eretmocerus hayati]|uniref:Uncharacterized protein n=1 Tax=Eretmocerus hayati TaxID=131215 RepID=A0ACC2PC79_9HYME|nr:hypothetical protein QAD02_016485 [Eretmocerus hayati]